MDLNTAIRIATDAHAGQKDTVGRPYILHPIRVMLRLTGRDEMIAAILHDVVEDSGTTLADLRRAGFSPRVLRAVDAMTRRDGEPYDDSVARAASDPVGRAIKIADLEDNMTLRREFRLMSRQRARMARYRRAYRSLTGREWKG